MEKSYVMVKPEFANYKEVIDLVKSRLTSIGMKILNEGFIKYDTSSAKQHYYMHVGKDFYNKLEMYITSDKAYGIEVEGENAILKIREIIGSTSNAKEGTIRYDVPKMLGLPMRITENVVHASDSVENANKELEIFKNLLNEKEKNMD